MALYGGYPEDTSDAWATTILPCLQDVSMSALGVDRQKDRDKDKHMQTDTHTDRHIPTDTHRQTHINRHTDRNTLTPDRQACNRTNSKTDPEANQQSALLPTYRLRVPGC